MENYLLIYRSEYKAAPTATPEQAQAMTKKWMDWISGLDAKNQLTDRGNRLDPASGKVLKPGNVVTNGPYAEIKEMIGGYSIVKAASYDEAVEIAKGCPIFQVGGHVEIRSISNLPM